MSAPRDTDLAALPPWEWWERELSRRNGSDEGMAKFVAAKVEELRLAASRETAAAPALDVDKAWVAFHEWEAVAAAGGSGMSRDQWVGASLFWNFLNNHGDTYAHLAAAGEPE